MSKYPIEKTAKRNSPFTAYSVAWSLLGTAGLTYLGIAFFAPDWLSPITPSNQLAEQHRTEVNDALAKMAADIGGVRATIGKLQLDLTSTKTEVAKQGQASKSMSGDLSALTDEVQRMKSNDKVAANGKSDGDQVADGSDAVSVAPKVINGKASPPSPIVTGSVDKADKPAGKASAQAAGVKQAKADTKKDSVIDFGPAEVKPAGKPIGITIASGSSVDGLKLSWSLLEDNHPALKNLKPLVSDRGDATNPNFGLVAGPVKSKAEAKKICKELSAAAVPCSIGNYEGSAL